MKNKMLKTLCHTHRRNRKMASHFFPHDFRQFILANEERKKKNIEENRGKRRSLHCLYISPWQLFCFVSFHGLESWPVKKLPASLIAYLTILLFYCHSLSFAMTLVRKHKKTATNRKYDLMIPKTWSPPSKMSSDDSVDAFNILTYLMNRIYS